MFTAIRPVYDRSTKTYKTEVVKNADPLLTNNGYLVFGDIHRAISCILWGSLNSSWNESKRQAVLESLISMGKSKTN